MPHQTWWFADCKYERDCVIHARIEHKADPVIDWVFNQHLRDRGFSTRMPMKKRKRQASKVYSFTNFHGHVSSNRSSFGSGSISGPLIMLPDFTHFYRQHGVTRSSPLEGRFPRFIDRAVDRLAGNRCAISGPSGGCVPQPEGSRRNLDRALNRINHQRAKGHFSLSQQWPYPLEQVIRHINGCSSYANT